MPRLPRLWRSLSLIAASSVVSITSPAHFLRRVATRSFKGRGIPLAYGAREPLQIRGHFLALLESCFPSGDRKFDASANEAGHLRELWGPALLSGCPQTVWTTATLTDCKLWPGIIIRTAAFTESLSFRSTTLPQFTSTTLI